MTDELIHKVGLVFGGGAEDAQIAYSLAQAGADVALICAADTPFPANLQADVEALGRSCLILSGDTSSAIKQVQHELGQINFFINCPPENHWENSDFYPNDPLLVPLLISGEPITQTLIVVFNNG